MGTETGDRLWLVLGHLHSADRDEMGDAWLDGPELCEASGFEPAEINDAVSVLVDYGYAEWIRAMGTAPYVFARVQLTAPGRYEYERLKAEEEKSASGVSEGAKAESGVVAPPIPLGSPYGFHDEDWEIIAERKATGGELRIVFGHQFKSEHFEAPILVKSVREMFVAAVSSYNELPNAITAKLAFQPLAAGYGEHLFNEIAREIISADIAVFETSDANPNVMIEMGVALTWGVRVLPIKRAGRPKPPSDISGQTWADYEANGKVFSDPEHESKLLRMVERSVRKKSAVTARASSS